MSFLFLLPLLGLFEQGFAGFSNYSSSLLDLLDERPGKKGKRNPLGLTQQEKLGFRIGGAEKKLKKKDGNLGGLGAIEKRIKTGGDNPPPKIHTLKTESNDGQAKLTSNLQVPQDNMIM